MAGGPRASGAVAADAAKPATSRMLPWRGESDFGPDAARLRRWLAEICVAELRDISFEGDFTDALKLLGDGYRRARGRGLSFVVRVGEDSGGRGPGVRLKRRSTTVSRAMDELCRQAGFFWELTPIGIMCFDEWNLEQSRRRVAQGELGNVMAALAEAQKRGDEPGVWRHAEAWIAALGDRRGVPEEPDRFLEVAREVTPLSAEEVQRGFDLHLKDMRKRRWWEIGLDPTRVGRLPREVADVIQGCMAVDRGKLPCGEEAMQFSREAGDFIMWAQVRGGKGVVPLPMSRNGDAGFRGAAGAVVRAASMERASTNGWIVLDPGDGFMQVDNGLCGASLFELYEQSKEPKYFDMGCEAAGWVKEQPAVANWVYNSHSVYLLARAYDVSGDGRYLEVAKRKVRLGILPGQVMRGALAGRWADPRNAGAAEHFTMARALALLLEVMPRDDADRPMIAASLRAALKAKQADFSEGRVPGTDSAMDALVAVERVRLLHRDLTDFDDCGVGEALLCYERIGAEALREGRLAFGPSAWGSLLELRARGAHLSVPRARAKRR